MATPMATGSGVKTSFQKKGKTKSPQIKGTRPSLHNNLLIVSTGVPSFDFILGEICRIKHTTVFIRIA